MPLLHEIKNRCVAQVVAYDRCLEQYSSQGDAALEKNCTPRLRDLWLCTEKVKAELEGRKPEVRESKQLGKEGLSR